MKFSRLAILAFALMLALLAGACDSGISPTQPETPVNESQDEPLIERENCSESRDEGFPEGACIG